MKLRELIWLLVLALTILVLVLMFIVPTPAKSVEPIQGLSATTR
jgi:hypothetical protein